MVISVRNKGAFKEEIIFHLILGVKSAIFLKNYFIENMLIFCYRWVSSGVKTHRMFCTYRTVCYKQHDGNFSEVICEDACVRDSANVYVRFFLKPQGNFLDETCRAIILTYLPPG